MICWAASTDSGQIQTQEKFDSIFTQGFSTETRNFIDIHSIVGAQEILKRIRLTENNIKERYRESGQNHTYNQQYENNSKDNNSFYKRNQRKQYYSHFNRDNKSFNNTGSDNRTYKNPILLNTAIQIKIHIVSIIKQEITTHRNTNSYYPNESNNDTKNKTTT